MKRRDLLEIAAFFIYRTLQAAARDPAIEKIFRAENPRTFCACPIRSVHPK
jgi:hypothetical protein